LDLPYYSNIGDILIWEGTEQFLKKQNIKCLYKSSCDIYKRYKASNDVTILLHGGGNFGDIWRRHQDFRLKVIKDYSNNPIIVLPQTVYYENSKTMDMDAIEMGKHSHLTICARDINSYHLLKDKFSNNTILLVPDMAFYIPVHFLNKFRKEEKKELLFLKRIDKELATSSMDILNNISSDLDVRDWPSMNQKNILLWSSYKLSGLNNKLNHPIDRLVDLHFQNIIKTYLIKMGVNFISSYKQIYTTRLHVAILATLLSKSYIFIDNSYGKNSTFYDTWLSDIEEIKFIR
jgi:pyruvyl transferase EpsO